MAMISKGVREGYGYQNFSTFFTLSKCLWCDRLESNQIMRNSIEVDAFTTHTFVVFLPKTDSYTWSPRIDLC